MIRRPRAWAGRLASACLSLGGGGLHAQGAPPPDPLAQVLQLLSQRQHGEADFTEQKYLSVLKRPLQSSGVLLYDAPDHLEQRVLLPRPQSVVLDHGILTMRLGTHQRVVALADYPQLAPLIDCIRATLAGDRAALDRVFLLDFSGTTQQWRLQLRPRDPQQLATLRQIDIEGSGAEIHSVALLQRDGDHSLMSITPHA